MSRPSGQQTLGTVQVKASELRDHLCRTLCLCEYCFHASPVTAREWERVVELAGRTVMIFPGHFQLDRGRVKADVATGQGGGAFVAPRLSVFL